MAGGSDPLDRPRPRYACFGALLFAFPLFGLSGAHLAWAEEAPGETPAAVVYRPGRGLEVGSTGLVLGGYANVEAEWPEGERAEFLIEELSMIVKWDLSRRLRFFSETELKDLLIVDERGRAEFAEQDDTVVLERLYLDYSSSDLLNVRVGKFLTPVGIWNVVHAAPLVWTVSRPLATTEEFFDQLTTGLMLYGGTPAGELRADYSLYGQPTDQLVERDHEDRSARRGAGGRVRLGDGGRWALGVSSVAQENERLGRWEFVGGADFEWRYRDFELWSEFVNNAPVRGEDATKRGLYMQATIPLVWNCYAIGRYEFTRGDDELNLGVLGFAYRPYPNLLIKTQYIVSNRRSEDAERGFAAAVAILF